MQSARRSARVHLLGGHEAVHAHRVAEAELGHAPLHRRAGRGRRRRSSQRRSGARSRSAGHRLHQRGHALLRDVAAGEHHDRLRGLAAPAARARPRTRPSSTSGSPRRPSAAQPRGVEAGEAEGALGHARAAAAAPRSRAPPARPEVLAPVLARPDLVPVHHQAEAAAAAAAPRRPAARSTGTRRCAPRRSARPWRSRWASTPAPNTSGGEMRRRPRGVELQPRARPRTTRTPGTLGRSPRSHWRRVR